MESTATALSYIEEDLSDIEEIYVPLEEPSSKSRFYSWVYSSEGSSDSIPSFFDMNSLNEALGSEIPSSMAQCNFVYVSRSEESVFVVKKLNGITSMVSFTHSTK